jgi:tetratricopeptide (TPR) repeat protein
MHTVYAEVPAPLAKDKKTKASDALEAGDLIIAFGVVVALTSILIYVVNIKNINANVALINSIRPEGVIVPGPGNTKKIAMKDVLDQNLFGTSEAREQLAQLAVQTQDPRVPEDIRRSFHDLAADEFAKELARDPENVRTLSFAAMFHARFGEYDKALVYFDKAIALAPKRQSTRIDLSTMFIAMGDYEKAESEAKIAYELAIENTDAALAYATALVYRGKAEEATRVMEPMSAQAIAYDSRLVNAYGNTRQYAQVIMMVNEKIARGFASGRDYFALAGAYLETGKVADSIASIEKAMSVDPSLAEQGKQLIEQIQGGRTNASPR